VVQERERVLHAEHLQPDERLVDDLDAMMRDD
jgi:hypothetical protein